MTTQTSTNPSRTARIAGLLYLLMVPLGILGLLYVPNALVVPGDVDIQGSVVVTTGSVKLSGNWDNSTGSFTAGTGTTEFTASSGTQTVDSGGTGVTRLFYQLTHSGAGTLQVQFGERDPVPLVAASESVFV